MSIFSKGQKDSALCRVQLDMFYSIITNGICLYEVIPDLNKSTEQSDSTCCLFSCRLPNLRIDSTYYISANIQIGINNYQAKVSVFDDSYRLRRFYSLDILKGMLLDTCYYYSENAVVLEKYFHDSSYTYINTDFDYELQQLTNQKCYVYFGYYFYANGVLKEKKLPKGHGKFIQENYYPNGKISEYIEYDNATYPLPSGLMKTWYANGQIRTDAVLGGGELHPVKSYYENGGLREEGYFMDRPYWWLNEHKHYWPNGQLKEWTMYPNDYNLPNAPIHKVKYNEDGTEVKKP